MSSKSLVVSRRKCTKLELPHDNNEAPDHQNSYKPIITYYINLSKTKKVSANDRHLLSVALKRLHHNIDNLALDNDNLLWCFALKPLLRALGSDDMLGDSVLLKVESILLLEA